MRRLYLLIFLIALLCNESHLLAQNKYSAFVEQPDPLPVPSICMVMIDPETEKNMIIWDSSPRSNISHYQVLRISGTGYSLVSDRVDNKSPVSIDASSKPGTKTEAYVLVSVDTCGNVTEKSAWHKPFLLQSSIGLNDVINLSWQPYLVNGEEYIFKSIVIYRGTDSTKLVPIDTIAAGIGSTTYTDEKPPKNVKLYYRIGGEKDQACDPFNVGDRKASGGPYVHSLSNLEDNRLQSTFVKGSLVGGSFKVYPNPMKTETRIIIDKQETSGYELLLYDLRGSLVKNLSGSSHSGEIILHRDGLESGCYFFELRMKTSYFGRLFVE